MKRAFCLSFIAVICAALGYICPRATFADGGGDPLADYYCKGVGHGCPSCSDVTGGCWTWSGSPYFSCAPRGGDSCDPNQGTVLCTGIFMAGGSCSGTMCSPNQCCAQSGIPAGAPWQIPHTTCYFIP
jgi:hypothetical protein